MENCNWSKFRGPLTVRCSAWTDTIHLVKNGSSGNIMVRVGNVNSAIVYQHDRDFFLFLLIFETGSLVVTALAVLELVS